MTLLLDTAWALTHIRTLLPVYGRSLTLYAPHTGSADSRFTVGGQDEERATVQAFIQPVGGGAMRQNRGIQDAVLKQYRLYTLDSGLETDTYFWLEQDRGQGTGDTNRMRILDVLYLHGLYVSTAESSN